LTESITCLVADDHPAVVQAVSEVLAKSGVQVTGQAHDGEQAPAARCSRCAIPTRRGCARRWRRWSLTFAGARSSASRSSVSTARPS